MAFDGVVDHLVRLGLPPDAVQLYSQLLTSGPATVADLARSHDAPGTLAAAIDALVAAGLIGRAGADGEQYAIMPPEPGMRALGARRERELSEATMAVQNAYRDAVRRQQAARGPTADQLVEVISGSAISERIRQAERHAQHEIRRLNSPPYHLPATTNQTELDHLAAGIRYRVVYAQSSLADADYFESNVLRCVKAGEQARVLAEVPVKLSLIDDTTALVSLSATDPDGPRSLLLVRPSTLLTALIGLFELCWQIALPILPSGNAASPLEPVEQRLLGLLASGIGDDAVIRTLRISRRTFYRYLEKLHLRAGVSSRFQLGVHAERQGWIRDGSTR